MGELVMKNRKRLLKTVGLLTAATVMTVSLNAESVLAYSTGEEAAILIIGMIVAFVVSLIVIKFLMGYIKKHNFIVFGWYRIVLGAIVLLCGIAGLL